MAGLFFFLASAEGAGLLFLPCCNMHKYKRLQRLLSCPCSYTANATKQRTGLYRGVSCDLPHSTAADNRPAQVVIILSAPRRTMCRPAQPPYYNKVYNGASLSWIHARRGSTPQTMQVRLGQLLPSADRWQVLTVRKQYRPGAPAEGSASPPSQGQPVGVSIIPAPGVWRPGTG